jgi:hypothetical protein
VLEEDRRLLNLSQKRSFLTHFLLPVRVFVVAVLAVAMLVSASGPAGAQGYTGWIEHPYPSAGLWYCDYYGEGYWYMNENGQWFPANPNW